MKHTTRLVITVLAAAGLQAAQAADFSSAEAQSVYGTLGLFGASIGYAHRFSDRWVSRLQLNTGSLGDATGHTDLSGNRYEVKQKAGAGISTFTDFYPCADSGWRLTGGFIVSQLKPEIKGQPNAQGSYSINDHSYSAAQVGTLSGRLKYNPVSVYLGGGWESAPIEKKGWRFVSDAGVFYAGKASATLTATGAASNPALQADLNAERAQLEKQGLGVMVQLGAAYSF